MSQGEGEICLAERDTGQFSREEGTAKRLPGQGESKPTLPLRGDPAGNRGARRTGSPRRAEGARPTSGPGNGFHAQRSRSDAAQISRRAAGPAVGGAQLPRQGLGCRGWRGRGPGPAPRRRQEGEGTAPHPTSWEVPRGVRRAKPGGLRPDDTQPPSATHPALLVRSEINATDDTAAPRHSIASTPIKATYFNYTKAEH